MSNLDHHKTINELVSISYQHDNIGEYALKVLSSHSNKKIVLDRMVEVLLNENDLNKVSICLDCLSPINNDTVNKSLINFIKQVWWRKEEKIVISYVNVVLNRMILELAIFLDKLKELNNNSIKIDTYLDNSMTELSKKFSQEILEDARLNKSNGLSLEINRRKINKKYKFLSNDGSIHGSITDLYKTKKISLLKNAKK